MNILTIIKNIEKVIVATLIILLAIFVLLTNADVVFNIARDIIQSTSFLVEANNLTSIFSSLLIVIIGLELPETTKANLKDDVFHVELVVLVAIIALKRKVIFWDFNPYTISEMITLWVMLISPAIVYFLIRKTDIKHNQNHTKKSSLRRT